MPPETKRSQTQGALDLVVIWFLRILQGIAIAALIMISAMGFAQIARSGNAFLEGYHWRPHQQEESHATDAERRGQTKLRHSENPASSGSSRDNSAEPHSENPSRGGTLPTAEKNHPQLPGLTGGVEKTGEKHQNDLGIGRESAPPALSAEKTENTTPDSSKPKAAEEDPIEAGPNASDNERNLAEIQEVLKVEAKKKKEREDDPISIAFQGLEFLLLAPLFFLLLRSLTEYVADLVKRGKRNAAEAAAGAGSSGQHRRSSGLSLGKEDLLETKALSFGLLFAIVATHMVGELISGAYSDSFIKGPSTEVCVGLSLLVVIAGIYFCIELLAHKIKTSTE